MNRHRLWVWPLVLLALAAVFAAYLNPHAVVDLANRVWACFGVNAVSDWIQRWAHLIRPGGTVLDVACGSGRHLRWLQERGFRVTGVDRDAAALQPLAAIAETIVADIEAGPWPLPGRRFDAVLVTNYLWRPQQATLLSALADGGVYLHETFADGQQAIGKPSRPDFLLQRGELITIAQGLRIVAYEDGCLDTPERCVQRIAAVAGLAAKIARFPLAGNA